MRVLVLSSVYARFSADQEVPWMRESLRRLQARGAEVQVLAPSWKGLRSHFIDGISVRRFRYAPAAWEILTHDEGAPSKMAGKPWMQLLALPYILNGTLQCVLLCMRWKPTVIHAHWPFPHGIFAWVARRLLGVPVVYNFHGAELLLARKHAWVNPVLRFLLRRCDAVLANSSFTAEKVRSLVPCSVMLSPYGTTLVASSLRPSAPDSAVFRILFVGRHIERKGLRYLIDAASQLDPSRFEVRIVGHGDLTHQLQEYGKRLAPQVVRFLGKLSSQDLAAEYAQAHCFVLPAIVDTKGDTEGLGVVLIEAAEYGLPLVASQVGGIPDVVQDGVSGILVPEKSPAALVEAFSRLANDPVLRESLVSGALALIGERFRWESILERQWELYQGLAARRR